MRDVYYDAFGMFILRFFAVFKLLQFIEGHVAIRIVVAKGPIINDEGGGWKIFLCTQIYFWGLLQKHEIYFVGYSITEASGATQNFFC